MDERLAEGIGLPGQHGQEAHAVLAPLVRRGPGAGDREERRIQVDGAREGIRGGPALDAAGPADHRRHAMRRLAEAETAQSEARPRILVELAHEELALGEVARGVVGGHDHEGVLGPARLAQGHEDAAEGIVGLHDDIGVRVHPAARLPGARGRIKVPRGRQGDHQEDGARILLRLTELGDGAHGQGLEEVLRLEVSLERLVALPEAVGRTWTERAGADEGLEAAGERTAGVGRTEIPGADQHGPIPLRLEERGQRRATLGDARGRPPGMPTRQHRLPRRRARGAVGMEIAEPHRLGGEAVEIRRADAAADGKSGDIAQAEVVRHQDHDVRLPRLGGAGEGGDHEEGEAHGGGIDFKGQISKDRKRRGTGRLHGGGGGETEHRKHRRLAYRLNGEGSFAASQNPRGTESRKRGSRA